LDVFKDKATADKFGKKVGDVVTVNTKDLFEDAHQLMDVMKVGHDDVHDLAVDVDFTISAINTTELAELNQELFDKLLDLSCSFTDELKAKIKEDAESHFLEQTKIIGRRY
jgi:trigger factor